VAASPWSGGAPHGSVAADGAYRLALWAADPGGNRVTKSWDVTLDTRRPVVGSSVTPPRFSPNGDRTDDSTRLQWTADEAASGNVRVFRGTTTYRRWTAGTAGSLGWNGRTAAGVAVADGRYTFRVELVDPAGNRTIRDAPVVIDRTAGSLAWSPNLFYPQDGDGYAATARVSFKLTRTATTTLRIYNNAGVSVRSAWSGRSLGAGTWSWTWNGRVAGGGYAPRGVYRAVLTATSWLGTTTLTRLVTVDAFSVAVSPPSPTAGETVTLTMRSAEPLLRAPSVTFGQNGLVAVTRTATLVSGTTYRVSFAVVAGGAGPATATISARDAAGRAVSQIVSLTVR
jgi:flagellar hook assembly protein FlgD